jgi:hypothetical protein
MAQNGGLMVPPQLAKLPSEVAREKLEDDQRDAMSATQQLGWVPKLYYWIKQKYGAPQLGVAPLPPRPQIRSSSPLTRRPRPRLVPRSFVQGTSAAAT